jgi:hypothetical protein
MHLSRLLYVSGASRALSDSDLEAILRTSRANNGKLGVTGMLLWADGAFIQVLEGASTAVAALVDRIRRDDRHKNVMVIIEEEADRRVFGAWEMGFKKLDPERRHDQTLFATTRQALENRIGIADGGVMLDLVLAFSPDFLGRE